MLHVYSSARTTGCGGGGGGTVSCRSAARVQRAPAYGGLVGRLTRQIPRRPPEHRLRAAAQAGEQRIVAVQVESVEILCSQDCLPHMRCSRCRAENNEASEVMLRLPEASPGGN